MGKIWIFSCKFMFLAFWSMLGSGEVFSVEVVFIACA
jgi:hypothetical protein